MLDRTVVVGPSRRSAKRRGESGAAFCVTRTRRKRPLLTFIPQAPRPRAERRPIDSMSSHLILRSDMSSRGARVARGLAAAGFATYIAALFHVAGGGLPPSMLALTLSLTFSGLACIALAGRRSSWWRLVLS